MQTQARDNYLVTEVMTATPQKLQLMLIEAALRFGQQARDLIEAGQEDQAGESLIRCQQIMAQLMGGVKPEVQPDLAQRVSNVYVFIFQCFVHAHLHLDQRLIDDALKVLAAEQETWLLVCEKLGSTQESQEPTPERFAIDA